MGEDEDSEEEHEEDEEDREPTEAENLVNHNRELIESLREQQREKIAQELLEQLPQGEGSGLDADKLDGLHVRDILNTWVKINGAEVYLHYSKFVTGIIYVRRLTRKVDYTTVTAKMVVQVM
jgi:hypothetical protein